MSMATDMPASRLFDAIFTRWLAQFEEWKTSTLAPEALYQQAYAVSNQVVADYTQRLNRELGSPFQAQIDAAVYALVALIDETVLYTSWPALLQWQEGPLEFHLWQTHRAGDLLPLRIQTLLSERLPGQRDLAALYLRGLTLGFGIHRDDFNQTAHQETCRLLWHFAFQQEPRADGIVARLNADSLGAPLQLPPRRRLPDHSRLHLVALIVLLALLLLSQHLWLGLEEAIDAKTLPTFSATRLCPEEVL
ncbi:DotU family type IV/VI secretion system protein [Citrobacter amalonaticus]|uniref:DotU family type IV/VI secretion system protein n=1 Tax=Citrobacter amalonaticus TaxID=35703 RepID=UPI001903E3B2|nr:DotU family type IV/VI secretion system protein [Citrobacter amalonaticus]MBJ9256826.1 DotU family type IV/VI secretion system protein [Citrobacter amalonaticus]